MRKQKKMKQLRSEFRETLNLMIPLLQSGKSMEGVVEALSEDMDAGATPIMFAEIQKMRNGIRNQIPVEQLFVRFGEESGVVDIRDFGEILQISKRSRGDLSEIMRNAASVLSDKMEAEEELRVLLAGRRMEQRILNSSPFFIIGMILMMNPDYLEPLFSTSIGLLLLLLCAGLMALALFLSAKISQIKI